MSGTSLPNADLIRQIADWKDPSQYAPDIVSRIRAAGYAESYEKFRERFSPTDLLNERDIAQLWRWEFLRRLPQYQREWNDPDYQEGLSNRYGLPFYRPDPYILCPENLKFLDSGRLNEKYIFHYYVDAREPVIEQLRGLAKRIKEFRRIAAVESDQLPARKQYSLYLRVLDAELSGASKADIGRTLKKSCGNPSKVGADLCRQAKRAQLLITRFIP